jgi:hypothetical protein
MAKRLALLGFFASVFAAPAAHACSIVIMHPPTWAERRAEAKKAIQNATAILDGEVVEPGQDGGAPAKIRVQRVFKGNAGAFVDVYGDSGNCDLNFSRVGEKVRLILFGKPDHYTTWVDDSNARHIDRILKSDRRKDWPLNPR